MAQLGRRRKYMRRTYMLDKDTLRQAAVIQEALGATSASETIRYAIRKVAMMVNLVGKGSEILACGPKDKVKSLDIPSPTRTV